MPALLYTENVFITGSYIIYMCAIRNYSLNGKLANCVVYEVPSPVNVFK